MTDHDQLDRLLHDVVRGRAGDPLAPPPDAVLGGLRARGAARRRRRSQLAAVAAAVVVVAGGVVGLTQRPDAGGDEVDVADEPPTAVTTDPPPTTATTTPTDPGGPGGTDSGTGAVPGPAIGAPASAYVGMDFVTRPGDRLWTADGRSLDYLLLGTSTPLGTAGFAVEIVDGDRQMLWLLAAGGTPAAGTVADAVELPPEAADASTGLGAGCTSAATGAVVMALVEDPPGGEVTVLRAWSVEQSASGARLESLPPGDAIGCTGLAAVAR